MRSIRHLATLGILAAVLVPAGCRSTGPSGVPESADGMPWWDAGQAEILVWHSDDPSYSQEMALEGSGLVAQGDFLVAASEKYAHLLRIDPTSLEVQTFGIDLPRYAEIEGVTVDGRELLMCDEANAAVWAIDIPPVGGGDDEFLEVRRLELVGLELKGGKLGVEGITVSNGPNPVVFLALERHGSEETGCRATLFKLRRQQDQLTSDGNPFVIPMEDCNWRLAGLQFWKGHLLALKTRYPGERYHVVEIDQENGDLTTVLDITELLIGVETEGWGNNIEGLTVTEDGFLWLISDNAMTDKAETLKPPRGRDKTLLMRIPPLNLPRQH